MTAEALHLRVRLTPRGGRDSLIRREGDVLHVRVAAPPIDGAANRSLIALLSTLLGIPKSAIEIVRGETSRDKTLRIDGLPAERLQAAIEAALPASATQPKGKGVHATR